MGGMDLVWGVACCNSIYILLYLEKKRIINTKKSI
jgi:hypothetical protein